MKRKGEELLAEYKKQQLTTKHRMNQQEELMILKQAVGKDVFPAYKFIATPETLQPLGTVARHLRKKLGYNKIDNEAWKDWWFSVGGKAVCAEIRTHRGSVSSHMKDVYKGM